MNKLLLLLPFLLPLQSCSDAEATSPIPQMEYQVLHDIEYNEYANITNKSTLLIRSQSDYEAELLKRTSDKAKSIDFESESILLVDMGPQSSGGYGISITVSENNDYILANITYQFPGTGCAVTLALTNPTKVITFETTKYVLINESITYSSC
ncbi:MAG: protease complex subunit PrcB family protein [Paraglaciecola sp.]|uniref:protease complex subunit PrcB family protein n=1 Tax=Paraglaciecola sp. TaxID=1920173 RepID=UPI003299266F